MSSTTSTTTSQQQQALVVVVEQFPCLSDNYGYLLHDATTGATAAIDTPDAVAYNKVLQSKGWTLTHIFNTHHHHDHVGGNRKLCQLYPDTQVYGPATETIPGRNTDGGLAGGDEVQLGSTTLQVLDVGGHTKGHIAYYLPQPQKAFVGDALFAMGCGRMFEGTPQQFWKSLQTLSALPPSTTLYCAHEYTVANAKFAVSVEPHNEALQRRYRDVVRLREQNLPTVPSTLQEELDTNPFLRCQDSREIQASVGIPEGEALDGAQIFAKVRLAKDRF